MKTSKLKSLSSLALGFGLILSGMVLSHQASAQDTCGAARLAPVAYGQVVQAFGDYDVNSLSVRGVTVETRAAAEISAPAAGIVEYAGPVDAMGQVVIVNIGHDYRVILAGLSQVSVKAGQRLTTYDKVGVMSKARLTARLYMELRCGEEPVDPQENALVAMR